jgi:hypothetical protein
LFGCGGVLAQDGRLQRVRDDVNSSSSSGQSSGSSSCNDDSILGNLFGCLLNGLFSSEVLLAPFYIPAAMLDDDYHHNMPFTPYPYVGSYRGYQVLPIETAQELYDIETNDVLRKNWAGRVSIENGNDFSGLNRFNGQLRLEHLSRFGIITNWNYFREDLGNGRYDETVIGDTNLTFRFAQNEIASMYAGLGFRVLTDRQQTNFGFNFTYGGDWFPRRPWVVSTSIDVGNLGGAGVFHVRATVGAVVRGWEIFAGYDLLCIGDTNLQGPLAGLRWWF